MFKSINIRDPTQTTVLTPCGGCSSALFTGLLTYHYCVEKNAKWCVFDCGSIRVIVDSAGIPDWEKLDVIRRVK